MISLGNSQLAIALVLLNTVTKGQLLKEGDCIDIPAVEKFDWHKIAGKWFIQERFGDASHISCPELQIYSIKEEDGTLDVYIGYLNKTSTEFNNHFYGVYTPSSTDSGRAVFDAVSGPAKGLYFPFTVVDIDYQEYMLVYTCIPHPKRTGTNLEFVIIYSRKRDKLTTAIKNRLSRLLDQYDVNANNFSSFDQNKETCETKTEKGEL
ncbi:uncharacterized protein LOC127723622 isoform X3 [Mytilus californianus]|uniref:uncharacterized protein LOC127723622 isoform X2 n=1 Tax=Mytilus californianus TaxID=6549 RepID=UPI002246DD1F|nr:uncharacterized protein LOC127723622 isoform X2 [Mytilus californianus]XP_052086292.1 uncharacterized protein LOC127723622 isoform X3 [Mytilus californianus]